MLSRLCMWADQMINTLESMELSVSVEEVQVLQITNLLLVESKQGTTAHLCLGRSRSETASLFRNLAAPPQVLLVWRALHPR